MKFDSLEDIKVLMDNFDPASLLPDLTSLVGTVEFLTRMALLAGPIVLLVMGVLYFLVSPREANYHFGYRCYFGMGSVEAWRFTQRLAGIVWAVLGLGLTIVMVILTSGFKGQPIMDTLGTGFTCLFWEIGLAAASCVIINLVVMLRFDRKGSLRSQKEY